MTINNFKHSIWNFIFSVMCLIPMGIVTVVLAKAKEWIWLIIYALFLVMTCVYFFISLINIQWIKILDDKIVVRNLFGEIKQLKYADIKKSFVAKKSIFSIKMLSINKPYIVLSKYKSLQKNQVGDAYNGKKHKYIVIPFYNNIDLIIKSKYKSLIGLDLEIK